MRRIALVERVSFLKNSVMNLCCQVHHLDDLCDHHCLLGDPAFALRVHRLPPYIEVLIHVSLDLRERKVIWQDERTK